METRNLVIICICIIAIVAVGTIVIAMTSAEETSLEVVSNSSLYDGDNFTVKLSANGAGIAN